jgi:hypothetical protein
LFQDYAILTFITLNLLLFGILIGGFALRDYKRSLTAALVGVMIFDFVLPILNSLGD